MCAFTESIVHIDLQKKRGMERIMETCEKDWKESIQDHKKVSVIIPVCNAEKYLTEAIESVMGQEYQPLELLLVENMSQDCSMDICREYEQNYENVHVYEEKKAGCAYARNRGMEEADGEYIVFLDADDYLKDSASIGKWIDALEREHADIAIGNYERMWDGKLLPAVSHEAFSREDRESEEFRFQGFFSTGTLSYVWGRAYRSSFLKRQNIHFYNCSYAEDKLFNMESYIKQARYAFINDIGYVYRRNEASISNRYKPDSCECWLKIAHRTEAEVWKSQNHAYAGMVCYTIAFAAFFDAKMEYVEKKKSLQATIALLKKYKADELTGRCLKNLAHGKQIKEIHSRMWKLMLEGFAFAMNRKWYRCLALMIKFLVDLRIDERLSDTGLRE